MGMGEPSSSTVDIRGGDSGEHHHEEDHEGSFAHENASPRELETRIAASSVAVSDADAASIRPVPSEDGDGELEDISLETLLNANNNFKGNNNNNPTSGSIPMPARGGSASTNGGGGGGESIALSSSAAPSSAASPRSLGLPPSPLSRASADFENLNLHHHHDGNSPAAVRNLQGATAAWGSGSTAGNTSNAGEQYKSSIMRKVTGAGGGEDGGGSVVSDVATEDLDASASMVATDGASGAPSLTGSVPRTITADIVAEEDEEEEEDQKVRDVEEIINVVAPVEEEQQEKVAEELVEAREQKPAVELKEEKEVEMPESTGGMEPLEVENNQPILAAPGAAVAAAATTSSLSAAPPAPKVNLGPEWEETFKGLLYSDGVDALGRPVVVLNADAVPPRMKSSALTYVKAHLEPLVNSGHYVIVFTARKAKLPSFWIMGAYQTLPRPYRKNVQYVILVKPSGFLKAMLAFMRPFVSKKAGRKIKAVDILEEMGEATGGEVTVHHLGEKFLNDDAVAAEAEAAAASAAAAAGP
jgi:Divergent CRAL/TRIO domain